MGGVLGAVCARARLMLIEQVRGEKDSRDTIVILVASFVLNLVLW